MKKLVLLILASSLWICTCSASATTLTYTEGLDLWNSNASTTLSNLDIGLNIVSGSVERTGAYPADTEFGDYGDFWDATLSTGMQITGIDFIYERLPDASGGTPGTFRIAVNNNIISHPLYPELYTGWVNGVSGTIPIGLSYPLGDDDYYFGVSTSFDQRAIINWSWEITVESTDTGSSPVPEPATIFLFGIGLLGLVGGSRRKK